MKIGFVLDSGMFGGAEHQALILAQALKKRGNTIFIFYLRKNKSELLDQLLAKSNISAIDLSFSFKRRHHTRLFQLMKLMLKLRKFNIDVFLPYTIRPNVNLNFAWQMTGARYCIWNQRDIGFGFGEKYRDKILWFALRNTSGIISNSREGFDFIKSFSPKPKPIAQIKNGIVLAESSLTSKSVRESLNISTSSFLVVMVANLTKYKDHLTLLRAWKMFVNNNQHFSPFLVLAGNHGDSYQEVQTFIMEHNLNKFVSAPGAIEDIPSLLNASDLCVFSSKNEGIPNGVLEAMAASKPIIATRLPGILEALGNDYKYLADPEDHLALSGFLDELLQSPDAREELGQMNYIRIKKEFSVKNLAECTITFLESLLNDKDKSLLST